MRIQNHIFSGSKKENYPTQNGQNGKKPTVNQPPAAEEGDYEPEAAGDAEADDPGHPHEPPRRPLHHPLPVHAPVVYKKIIS